MKEGAGEDPFAESEPERESESGTADDAAQGTDATGTSPTTGDTATGDAKTDDATTSDATTESDGSSGSGVDGSANGNGSTGTAAGGDGRRSIRIPYKFRRDSVQDDRERVPLFLMEETKSAEREALRELEDRFDDDVSLTDLREAVVAVGLGHLDEVEDQLAEWGYGVTFEE